METIKSLINSTNNSGVSTTQKVSSTETNVGRTWWQYFQTKNFLIIILSAVIILLFLGINIFIFFGQIFQAIIYALKPVITQVLLLFGLSINTIGDLFDGIGDVIDSILHIFGNGIQSVSYSLSRGNSVIGGASMGGGGSGVLYNTPQTNIGMNSMPTQSMNNSNTMPTPNMTFDPIQHGPTNNKSSWCLIGESAGTRSCVSVTDSSKCMSGQLFNDQNSCVNPLATNKNPANNMKPSNSDLTTYKPTIDGFRNGMMKTNPVPSNKSQHNGKINSKPLNVSNMVTTLPNRFK